MSSATDIITYIGVPLAVLGVLPILYTCLKALITLNAIKRELRHNGLDAIARGSLLTGVVEIELPRLNITPLERDEADYWKLARSPSSIRGGTWSVFNWDKLVTGHSLYRLQYKDQMRQPQAEVDFEELIAYLLDRGAIPSVDGFRMLRTSSLWTPTGTTILLSPDTTHSVLKVAVPDDSDGVLSLALGWRPDWNLRDINSLPPYWMRLETPNIRQGETEKRALIDGAELEDATQEKELEGSQEHSPAAIDLHSRGYKSVRLRMGQLGVQDAREEESHKLLELRPSIKHLTIRNERHGCPGLWFACAATALGSKKGTGLWSYTIPEHILSFAESATIPAGVMVVLDVIDEKDAPACFSPWDDELECEEERNRTFARLRRMGEEARLPPDQQQAARLKRGREDLWEMQEANKKRQINQRVREETRMYEALRSSRIDPALVAVRNLEWLMNKEHLQRGHTMRTAVEEALYTMLLDESKATAISDMLNKWKSWADSGGMNQEHLDYVKKSQSTFALASCIVGVLSEGSTTLDGSVGNDMAECIRVWRKVRLG
ncbi:MAG: hypothetical protein M1835_000839 [Candelina submexicana]|nr:MAG: hypothetical protein M1835_000839 [Candelina submexicana]